MAPMEFWGSFTNTKSISGSLRTGVVLTILVRTPLNFIISPEILNVLISEIRFILNTFQLSLKHPCHLLLSFHPLLIYIIFHHQSLSGWGRWACIISYMTSIYLSKGKSSKILLYISHFKLSFHWLMHKFRILIDLSLPWLPNFHFIEGYLLQKVTCLRNMIISFIIRN